MKKFKLTKIIALTLILSLLCGTTAFADSHNSMNFDFEQMTVHLAPGDTYTMRVWVYDGQHDGFSVYKDVATSKNTYAWSDFKTGWTTVDFHIGEDETAERFGFWFYIDETDCHDNVVVEIVDPIKSDVKETREAAIKAKMGQ